MPLISNRSWGYGLAVVALSACMSAVSAANILLRKDTVRLEGWFSAKGEWTLFPNADFKTYDPYAEEDRKCVSLINGTESGRSQYEGLQGKKIAVVGFAVRYDDLANGTSAADQLLSKKYFGNEIVENSCLRDLVFVVRRIEAEN